MALFSEQHHPAVRRQPRRVRKVEPGQVGLVLRSWRPRHHYKFDIVSCGQPLAVWRNVVQREAAGTLECLPEMPGQSDAIDLELRITEAAREQHFAPVTRPRQSFETPVLASEVRLSAGPIDRGNLAAVVKLDRMLEE